MRDADFFGKVDLADHSTVKLTRLLFDQLPAAVTCLDSMPGRP